MVETLLIVIIIILTILIVQYAVKPLMKGYKDRSWYALSINIASIIVVMILGVAVILVDTVSEMKIIETGIDFIIQIFGAVFIYEVLKNIHKAIGNGGRRKANNG